MSKHKTSELTGSLLDLAVGLAEKLKFSRLSSLGYAVPDGVDYVTVYDDASQTWRIFKPHIDGADYGPLMEKYGLPFPADCDTPGIAICRAVVGCVFGEYVELPE